MDFNVPTGTYSPNIYIRKVNTVLLHIKKGTRQIGHRCVEIGLC